MLQSIVLFYFFAIHILIIETRFIPEDTRKSFLNDLSNDDQQKLHHAFSGYRHRFGQSPNFKALRWSLESLQVSGQCELCEVAIPLVSLFIDFFVLVSIFLNIL